MPYSAFLNISLLTTLCSVAPQMPAGKPETSFLTPISIELQDRDEVPDLNAGDLRMVRTIAYFRR
jgi:hypothetical protein